MRVLVVYCHPSEESFGRALRDAVLGTLESAGHEVRLTDLYGEKFEPVMGAEEWAGYHQPGDNEAPVVDHLANLRWAEALVFVYPTWWFGLPAMLKGWLDRVFVPHATFTMPSADTPIQPRLTHIRHVVVITTCGASWLISKFMGEPGRKTLLRGIRRLCHPWCRSKYLAHYLMDSSTPGSRAAFLAKVEATLRRL